MTRSRFNFTALSLVLLALLSFVLACDKLPSSEIKIDTEYKAIFLENGQIFFGKLDEHGHSYILLTDIFYVQSQVVQQDKDNKDVRSILIKRGSEWHGPDRMYINRSKIVVIEPVSLDSRVMQLIKEAKARKP